MKQTFFSKLRSALAEYDFPCVTFDFVLGREILHDNMNSVEPKPHACACGRS